jgi:hypothetical protein
VHTETEQNKAEEKRKMGQVVRNRTRERATRERKRNCAGVHHEREQSVASEREENLIVAPTN